MFFLSFAQLSSKKIRAALSNTFQQVIKLVLEVFSQKNKQKLRKPFANIL